MIKKRATALVAGVVAMLAFTACRPIEQYFGYQNSGPNLPYGVVWISPGGEPGDVGWFFLEVTFSNGEKRYSPTYDINNMPGGLQRGPAGEYIVSVYGPAGTSVTGHRTVSYYS